MIDPQGLSIQQWSDAVISDINTSWPLGVLQSEDAWQEWATGLVRAPELAQRVLPDPYGFSDWRAWAERAAPLMEGSR